MAKSRLDALAGLRLVAAIVVAIAHLPAVSRDPALGRVAVRFLSEGLYGLTFFFVLSGFVLAYGYHERLAQPTRAGLKSYYLARVARIWPLHLLTLGLAILLPISPQPGGAGPLAANIFLVHAWVPDLEYIQSYNSVSWTLSIEAFFYLVCPLILWAVGRWKSAGPLALYLAAVGVWLLTCAVVWTQVDDVGIWPLYVCNVCPLVRLGEFAVGVLLGLAFVRGRVESGPAIGISARTIWTVLELVAVAIVLLLIYRSHKVPLLFRMNGYYLLVVGLLVAIFARQRGFVSGLLGSRPAVYLSNISFAFYLLHAILFTHIGPVLPSELGAWPKAGLLILITGVAAAGLFHGVETPLRDLIIGWGKPRSLATAYESGLFARFVRRRFGRSRNFYQ